MTSQPYTIAALYCFVPVADAPLLRTTLKDAFTRLGLCGSLLVAPEGVNGTLAGQGDAVDSMLGILGEHVGLRRDDVKFSSSDDKPFNRLRVRLKKEIITFKQGAADPSRAGTYVTAKDWNGLMDDPDVLVVDVRNDYETDVGIFNGAIDPRIARFTDFATYVRDNLAASKKKKIAMYCTGGIRCEKASAFMRAEGFDEVYHLKGGILKYLEDVPADESRWKGECFVFDKRVAVGHGLSTGAWTMCMDCGTALPANDPERAHPCRESLS